MLHQNNISSDTSCWLPTFHTKLYRQRQKMRKTCPESVHRHGMTAAGQTSLTPDPVNHHIAYSNRNRGKMRNLKPENKNRNKSGYEQQPARVQMHQFMLHWHPRLHSHTTNNQHTRSHHDDDADNSMSKQVLTSHASRLSDSSLSTRLFHYIQLFQLVLLRFQKFCCR